MKRLLPWPALLALPAAAQTCPDLTALQRAAGFVTWQNLLQFAGIGLLVAGTLYFASGLIRALLVRRRLVEALLWAMALAGLVAGAVLPAAHAAWPVLFGALLLPGASAFSARLRGWSVLKTCWWQRLGLAWGAIALVYQLPAVGFLAVAVLLALLGLFIGVGRFCYCMGFSDDDALARTASAGALLAIGFAALQAARVPLGPFEVFRTGGLWLGAFAWQLGVLIVATKWYTKRHYAARQALAVASLGGALGLGLLAGVTELTTMAAAFLVFFLLGKTIELPVQGRLGFGIKLIAAGALTCSLWLVSDRARELLAVAAL
jgi:hypothetical protein